MNPGLIHLLKKAPVARLRFARRRLKGTKGLLQVAGLALVLLLMVGGNLASMAALRLSGRWEAQAAADLASTRRWGPVLLTIVLLTVAATARAPTFRPAEVAFLFPAPIPRRDLLAYQMASRLGLALLTALWLTLLLPQRLGGPITGWLGLSLVVAWVEVSKVAAGIAAAAVPDRTALGARVAAGTAIALVLAPAWRATAGAGPLQERLATFAGTGPVRVLTAPARPFIDAVTATDLRAFLPPALLAAAMIAGLGGLALTWDFPWTEAALGRRRDGRAKPEGRRPARGGYSLPHLPFLGGAGPLARRQLVELGRTPRALLAPAIVPAAMACSFAWALRGAGPTALAALSPPVVMAILLPVLMHRGGFDFHRDLDRMAWLKSLPVPAGAVAAGQVLPSAAALLLTQGVGAAATLAVGGRLAPEVLAALAVVLPPLAFVVAATDNAVFLLVPYRPPSPGDGGLPIRGRLMLHAFARMASLGAVLGSAALAGVVAGWSTGSTVAGFAAATAWLYALCVPALWVVTEMFRRFDVTTDVPF